MTTFTGICIGGPLAGKRLDGESPRYQYIHLAEPDLYPLPHDGLMDAEATMESKAHTYHHEAQFVTLPNYGPIQVWRHESISDCEDTMLEVIKFYCEQEHEL